MTSPVLSRRAALALGLAGGVGAMVPGFARGQAVGARVESALRAMAEGQSLDLPSVRSANGKLSVALNVTYGEFLYPLRPDGRPGSRRYVRTWNGKMGGSIWRVRPGDRLEVALTNNLPPNPDPQMPVNVNVPHQFNSTNLHLHGMHVSPAGFSDNVLIEANPGGRIDYAYDIPAYHPPGIRWYHAHKHGATAIQLASGMSGALMVEGDIDLVPEIAAAREHIFMCQCVGGNDQGLVEDFPSNAPPDENVVTLNGYLQPILVMRPGEVQRWHFVNALSGRILRLFLEGHSLNLYAIDGLNLPRLETRSGVEITNGGRASMLVRAGAPGLYFLKTDAAPEGSFPARPPAVLAMVLVTSETPVAMGLPQGDLPQSAMLRPITDAEITGRRTLVFSQIVPDPSAYLQFRPLIDNRQFDPNRVDQVISVGAVEEWTLTNAAAEPHPFHIHVNPFQVVAVGGQRLATPYWADSVTLPPLTSITIRSRFLRYTGKSVLHCHNLGHEDLGMMQLIEFR